MLEKIVLLGMLVGLGMTIGFHDQVVNYHISKKEEKHEDDEMMWIPTEAMVKLAKNEVSMAQQLRDAMKEHPDDSQDMIKNYAQSLTKMTEAANNNKFEDFGHLNDDKYVPPVTSKLPHKVKKSLIKRLKREVAKIKGQLSDERIVRFKKELIEQFRRYGILNAKREVNEIFKGVNSRILCKNLEGPYFEVIEDLRAQMLGSIEKLCKEIYTIETKRQLNHCVAHNFDILIINLILNLDPNHHPIIAALQNEVYHGEKAAQKFNKSDEKKRLSALEKKNGGSKAKPKKSG